MTETTDKIVLPVEGMTCAACQATVQRALTKAPGVEKAASAYGLSTDELVSRAAELCPVEGIGAAAKAGVPVCIIHGDVDTVVPLRENSVELQKRYSAEGVGTAVRLVVPPGQGHNYWEGFFRCQELVDFAIARAQSGAK